MSKSETTINKEIKEINAALSSPKKEKVLEGIKLSRAHANQDSFRLMLETLKKTDEPEVEAAIIQFLYDLKDVSSIDPLIEALNDEEMRYYHSFLIATFWQSALDGSDHLDLFVKRAIDGEYMTALEALTVVENFDSSFSADLIMECSADLNLAIEEENEEEKKNILISLKEVVDQLPQEGE